MFSKETYINRRNKLKREAGKGILLFLGNNESPMNYADNTYHFRQDSSFLYFFGLKHPGLAAVLDCESGPLTTSSGWENSQPFPNGQVHVGLLKLRLLFSFSLICKT